MSNTCLNFSEIYMKLCTQLSQDFYSFFSLNLFNFSSLNLCISSLHVISYHFTFSVKKKSSKVCGLLFISKHIKKITTWKLKVFLSSLTMQQSAVSLSPSSRNEICILLKCRSFSMLRTQKKYELGLSWLCRNLQFGTGSIHRCKRFITLHVN